MLKMPDADTNVLARRAEIAAILRDIVPGEGVITEEAERRAYETDGLTAYKQLPMIVALPETTEQVRLVLKYLIRYLKKYCHLRHYAAQNQLNLFEDLTCLNKLKPYNYYSVICCHLIGTPSNLYLLDSSRNFSYSVFEE